VTLFVSVVANGGCGSAQTPTAPTVINLSGTWSGTSAYPNAPFQLTLTHSGSSLTGRYSDAFETDTAVAGVYINEPGIVSMSVHSADLRLFIDGTVIREKSIQGLISLPQPGVSHPPQYQFAMTR
jgi:hypothetical protein